MARANAHGHAAPGTLITIYSDAMRRLRERAGAHLLATAVEHDSRGPQSGFRRAHSSDVLIGVSDRYNDEAVCSAQAATATSGVGGVLTAAVKR